jgi:hypothetical protein
VADSVKTHEGWGLGSYCFFNVDPTIHATRSFEVPVTPTVKLHDILTVSLGGVGTIDHVVNDSGAAAQGRIPPRSTSSAIREPSSRQADRLRVRAGALVAAGPGHPDKCRVLAGCIGASQIPLKRTCSSDYPRLRQSRVCRRHHALNSSSGYDPKSAQAD